MDMTAREIGYIAGQISIVIILSLFGIVVISMFILGLLGRVIYMLRVPLIGLLIGGAIAQMWWRIL